MLSVYFVCVRVCPPLTEVILGAGASGSSSEPRSAKRYSAFQLQLPVRAASTRAHGPTGIDLGMTYECGGSERKCENGPADRARSGQLDLAIGKPASRIEQHPIPGITDAATYCAEPQDLGLVIRHRCPFDQRGAGAAAHIEAEGIGKAIAGFLSGTLDVGLNARHPVRSELPVVTDLTATNNALGPDRPGANKPRNIDRANRRIIDNGYRNRGGVEVSIGLTPTVTDVAADIEAGPTINSGRRWRVAGRLTRHVGGRCDLEARDCGCSSKYCN